MKRPSFQFYPGDWKRNSKLRRCSEAARGAWIDILCLLHDSDEYGVCRWPLDELARASGVPLKFAKELATKDVLKGADTGSKPYIYTPKHAGKEGDPVVLVDDSEGPCWYCSRFVRDEYIRQKRGQSTQFSSENQPPKPTPNHPPKGGIGERQGDGPSSSSSSSLKTKPLVEQIPLDMPFDSPVRKIFEYWQKIMESPRSVLDNNRKGLIERSLKNYSPEDICKAIRGCSKSPHHMGENERKTKYNGLDLILRNAEKIDSFIGIDLGSSSAKPWEQ